MIESNQFASVYIVLLADGSIHNWHIIWLSTAAQ